MLRRPSERAGLDMMLACQWDDVVKPSSPESWPLRLRLDIGLRDLEICGLDHRDGVPLSDRVEASAARGCRDRDTQRLSLTLEAPTPSCLRLAGPGRRRHWAEA